MTTSYTSLLGLALPVEGELSGTWGDTVNNSITSLVDSAVAGTTTLSTDADVTLSTTSGIANDARQAVLLCSGARTAQRTITAPARSKVYVVINATSGGYAVKLVGNGPTTGVTVAAGKAAVLAWNGSDFVTVATTDASVLSGVLPVANGGTGVTTSTGSGSVVLSTSPTLVTPALGTPLSGTLSSCTGFPAASLSGNVSLTSQVSGTLPVANGGTGVTTSTGSGNAVLSNSPTLVTPILGTPTSGTLTNCTGYPTSALSGTVNLTTQVTGTLPVANGGTGQASALTQYGLVYASTTTAMATTGAGTTTTVLHGNASGAPTYGAVSLTADVSGTLPVANGGTGQSSALTQYGVAYASATTALATTSAGTTTTVLHGNASGAPTFGAVSLTADVSGTLPVANGGTGVTTSTGSGNVVLSTSPTLVTPALGTPASATLTNATGLPLTTGVTGTLPFANGGTGITNNPNVLGLEFVIDGGGAAITTGIKGYLEVPFACTVSQWTLLADTSGSITVDVYSDAYASYGTNTSMVGGGTKPAIASATKAQSAPSSWTTTSIAAGNIIGFNVTANATCTRVTISLKVTRT